MQVGDLVKVKQEGRLWEDLKQMIGVIVAKNDGRYKVLFPSGEKWWLHPSHIIPVKK